MKSIRPPPPSAGKGKADAGSAEGGTPGADDKLRILRLTDWPSWEALGASVKYVSDQSGDMLENDLVKPGGTLAAAPGYCDPEAGRRRVCGIHQASSAQEVGYRCISRLLITALIRFLTF